MEFLVILFMGVIIAATNVILPEPKDNNQLEEAKVVQTKNIESPVVKVKPEELVKKPELVKEEVKPVPIQKEEVKPEPIQKEEANWLNIILYIIGAIAVIAAGIYFFKRKKITPPVSVADNIRPKFDEEIIPALSEQKPTQEETQEEIQEEIQEEQQETQEEIQEEQQEIQEEQQEIQEEQHEIQEETQEEKSPEDNSSDDNNKK